MNESNGFILFGKILEAKSNCMPILFELPVKPMAFCQCAVETVL